MSDLSEISTASQDARITFSDFTITVEEMALLRRIRERQDHAVECCMTIEINGHAPLSWFVGTRREGIST
jgi:hypothetical protein